MRLRAGKGGVRQKAAQEFNDGSNIVWQLPETQQLDDQPAIWVTVIVGGDLLS